MNAATQPSALLIWTRTTPRQPADLLLFAVTSVALALFFLQTLAFRPVDWIYLLQHLLVLGFALTRPDPVIRDNSARSNTVVAIAYLYPYAQVACLYRWPGKATCPGPGLFLVTVAAFLSVVCLVALGKRFGVRPALRGLVTGGPYRLVRHPLYFSYLIADIGYNLQLANMITVALVVIAWTAMILRICAEEKVLARDSNWPAYAAQVRYRLVPHLW